MFLFHSGRPSPYAQPQLAEVITAQTLKVPAVGRYLAHGNPHREIWADGGSLICIYNISEAKCKLLNAFVCVWVFTCICRGEGASGCSCILNAAIWDRDVEIHNTGAGFHWMPVLQPHQVAEPEIKPSCTVRMDLEPTTVGNMYDCICGDDYAIRLSGSTGRALLELVAVCWVNVFAGVCVWMKVWGQILISFVCPAGIFRQQQHHHWGWRRQRWVASVFVAFLLIFF